MSVLVDAGALLPLDEYIDQYPEFKETWFTEAEWDKFRQPDGVKLSGSTNPLLYSSFNFRKYFLVSSDVL